MAFISPKVVSVENQISGGKPTGELREHVLVSRGEATTPALKWTLLPVYGVLTSGETLGRWNPGWRGSGLERKSCISTCSDGVHTFGNHI